MEKIRSLALSNNLSIFSNAYPSPHSLRLSWRISIRIWFFSPSIVSAIRRLETKCVSFSFGDLVTILCSKLWGGHFGDRVCQVCCHIVVHAFCEHSAPVSIAVVPSDCFDDVHRVYPPLLYLFSIASSMRFAVQFGSCATTNRTCFLGTAYIVHYLVATTGCCAWTKLSVILP